MIEVRNAIFAVAIEDIKIHLGISNLLFEQNAIWYKFLA